MTPLGYEEMRRELERITYKPGWRFDLDYDVLRDFIQLVVTVEVNDASPPHRRTLLAQRMGIVPYMVSDVTHFHHIVRHLVQDIEMHEVKEWLKRDGKPLFDPHPEVTKARKGLKEMIDS